MTAGPFLGAELQFWWKEIKGDEKINTGSQFEETRLLNKK